MVRVRLEQAREAVPVENHHGQDGPELDDHVECFGLGAGEIQKMAGDNEMAGAGDGEEFGQSFDDAENESDIPGGHGCSNQDG